MNQNLKKVFQELLPKHYIVITMPIIYTKCSLNQIKKNDLIDMFYEQQYKLLEHKEQFNEIAGQNIEVARKNIENINEIKKLKEDITNHPDFEEIATDWYERHNWIVDKDQFTELQEENKKLKKTIKNSKKIRKIQEEAYDKLEEETETLKEEVDELEGRLEDVEHEASEWEDSYNELKAEKESEDAQATKDYDQYEEKIGDLQEENEKLKKYENMIHNVWSELYWKDKYGEDVGWKDISECVDYDEDFVKKEVVEEEEEEQEDE